jgi:hypothetical protein
MAAVYKGKLTLDRVTGIRHDKEQKAVIANDFLKKSTKLPTVERSMKTETGSYRGKKY